MRMYGHLNQPTTKSVLLLLSTLLPSLWLCKNWQIELNKNRWKYTISQLSQQSTFTNIRINIIAACVITVYISCIYGSRRLDQSKSTCESELMLSSSRTPVRGVPAEVMTSSLLLKLRSTKATKIRWAKLPTWGHRASLRATGGSTCILAFQFFKLLIIKFEFCCS